MNFLTRLILDFETVARLRIRDAYDWHKKGWACFPSPQGKKREFLTRLDAKANHFQLLIVSPEEPKRPEWCPPHAWHGTKRIRESYFSHQRYQFQLRANPTKKVAAQNKDGSYKKNGCRKPLMEREELVDWIKRKGKQGGFIIDEAKLYTITRRREYFRKNSQLGMHHAVEFQGELTVTDQTKFREAFKQGIGSGKAFGFGLLMIAPIK